MKNLRYTAMVGDAGCFAEALWAMVYQQGIPYAGRVAVTVVEPDWEHIAELY